MRAVAVKEKPKEAPTEETDNAWQSLGSVAQNIVARLEKQKQKQK